MAIKDAKTIFGDGAGVPGDAGWVPIDTSAPSGKAAANRGIDTAEQVTAAIQNRPAYALARNDEDLDARMTTLETGGIDDA